jgi:hypothetical protein
MKRLLASLALIAAASALSGCYYDPGYSYVRGSGYSGDAYYGEGGSAYYVPGYYAAPGYYDGYYGSGYYGGGYYGYSPGVSIGISSGWYGGSRYRHDGYRGHRDYDRHAGQWQGRHDGDGRSHGGRGDQGHWGRGQAHPSGGHARGGDDARRDARGRGSNRDRRD